MSGAEISNVVNLAAILAVRKQKQKVSFEEILSAIERVRVGIRGKSIDYKDK